MTVPTVPGSRSSPATLSTASRDTTPTSRPLESTTGNHGQP